MEKYRSRRSNRSNPTSFLPRVAGERMKVGIQRSAVGRPCGCPVKVAAATMTGRVRVDLVDLPRRVYTMGPRPLLVLKVSNRYASGEKME